ALPRPRQGAHALGDETAGEDLRQRVTLSLVTALVDVHDEAPRRPRLVVVVAVDESCREPREVGLAGLAFVDEPRERAEADPMRGAPAGPATDHPAGADRVAVAGLEVAARDPPRPELAHEP